MSKFCSKCGKGIDDNTIVCPHCNQILVSSVASKNFIQSKTLGILEIVLGGLSVLCGLISFDYFPTELIVGFVSIGVGIILNGIFLLTNN